MGAERRQQLLDQADRALAYFNPDVVKRNRLPALSPDKIKEQFDNEGLVVNNDPCQLENDLKAIDENTCVLLIMTSGNFSGIDLNTLAREVVAN